MSSRGPGRAAGGAFFAGLFVVVACLLGPSLAAAAPTNDDFANAQPLAAGLPQSIFASNSEATVEPGEPQHAGKPGGHSVWFSLTPATSGPVDISTCGFGVDTLLAVYTGSSVDNLTPVAANDDAESSCFESSDVEFTAAAGTTYRIAVDGKGETEGSFQLKLNGQPANDDFANASTIFSSLPGFASGTTEVATKEPGEPNHAGDPGGHSVWYSWTPVGSGQVDITACSFSGVDTVLAVYTGAAVDALTPIAGNDNGPGCSESGGSDVRFPASAGTTYRIVVDSKGSRKGAFNLHLTGPAANDDLADAQPIGPGLPISVSGDTTFATKEPGEPDHAGDAGGHSVWFSWTAPSSGPVGLSTSSCPSNGLEAVLAVYTGSTVNSLTPVAGSDHVGVGCGSVEPPLEFVAVAGTTYRIAVDGKGSGEGSFSLQITGGPANDGFSAAQVLAPALPSGLTGTNRLATKEPGEPNHAGDPGGHSVWYSWTAPANGVVGASASACFSGGFEPLIGVYTGSAVDSLTPVPGNANRVTGFCTGREVQFTATAGTTYRIAVDAKNGGQGSFQLQLNPPPANDDFANAEPIASSLPASASGLTRRATKEPGEPNHAGDPGGHSVWYSWTATSSGPVDIATNTCSGSGFDTLLAVYTGSAVNNLTQVASNDDGPPSECFENGSEVEFDAVASTTYRIAVDGANGDVGSFSLRLSARPQNDDFAGATTVGLSGEISQLTNRLATKEAGEPNHAGNSGGHSLWFSWTPTSSGPASVSTCSFSEFDPLLAVYTGSAVNNLTPVAANDDGADERCGPTDSEVEFTAVAGTTYRIAVDGKNGNEGRFSLRLQRRPVNDDFADAQALGSGLPQFEFGTTEVATKELGEPNHAGDPGGHSVWYSWTPVGSGPVELSIDGCRSANGLEPLLGVYTGSTLNDLTPVASSQNSGSGCASEGAGLQFTAIAGTTYRIAVDGRGGSRGSFQLELTGSPTNDAFAAAQKITGPALVVFGTNSLSTKEAGEPDHAGDPGGHSLWYSWTAPGSGPVDLSTCSEETRIDTLLAVYTGSAVDSLTPVAANDDGGPGCESGASDLQFTAVAGTTYRIAVDGKDGSKGRFRLLFTLPPSDDAFGEAEELGSELPSFGSSSTALATKEPGEPNHAGNPGGHSVWFSWTPTTSETVAVSTNSCFGGEFDTLLAVYTGSAVNSLTPVAANDDIATPGCSPTESGVDFVATAGVTYRIAVDAKGAGVGSFQLRVAGVPANDDFAAAQTLGSALPRLEINSNHLASKQPAEPDHAGAAGGASVWFKWTAPRTGPVGLDACESNFDTLLAVYTGSAIDNLTPVAANDDGGGSCGTRSKLSFDAVAGTRYRIAVDGKGGAQGSVKLRLDAAAANDDFENARPIPGSLPRFASGSTLVATTEPGEPNHAGAPGGHSVWFAWTPTSSGPVQLATCESDFDTLLAVYTGQALNDLVPVASDNDGAGCGHGASQLVFSAVAGTTYRIAVDGRTGDDGFFQLQLSRAGATEPTLTVSRTGSGTVVSSPAGIECGPTCSHGFQAGTAVTLTATPAAGSAFAGWSGAGCVGTAPCHLVLAADTTVEARFEALPSGGSGPAPAPTPPRPAPTPPKPAPKPLRCKRGFKKKKIHGKLRCVKKQRQPTKKKR